PTPTPVEAVRLRPVAVTLVAGPLPSVMAPAEISVTVVPVTVFRAVSESSLRLTVPVPLAVRLPKFTGSPALLPRSIDVPLRLALPVTARLLPAWSVTAPPATRLRPPLTEDAALKVTASVSLRKALPPDEVVTVRFATAVRSGLLDEPTPPAPAEAVR